jgi:hypothetical protein
MKLTDLFCDSVDFCQTFIPIRQKSQLTNGDKKRIRAYRMSYSEMMTLLVATINRVTEPSSGFYQQYVRKHWLSAFPVLLSYHRFIELLPKIIIPLTAI